MIADPVNWWPMDEGAGALLADVAGGASAALNGTPAWVSGRTGGGSAVRFAGLSQYASYTQQTLPNTAHSIAFWVIWNASGSDGVLIGGPSGNYAPYMDGSAPGASIYYSAGTGNFATVLHGGFTGWTHFVITRAGGVVKFYKNGALLGTGNLGSTTNTLPLTRFGEYESGGSLFPAAADLDDVRFYSRELTASDVAELFAYPTKVQRRRKRIAVPHRSRRSGFAR